MDSLYLIMFIGLSFFVLFLFFYILKVEKTFEEKLNSFEMSIENINRDIFLLKKEIKNSSLADKIDKLEYTLDSLVDDIRNLENKNSKIIKNLKSEIEALNQRIKNTSLNIDVVSKNEEKRILDLYKGGYSIEEISKSLRIPVGEVEFIIKFSSNS